MTFREQDSLTQPAGSGSFLWRSWIACRHHWRTAISIFVIVVGLTILVTVMTPREYLAEMKLLVKNDRTAVVLSPGSSVQDRGGSDTDETAINSELQIMTSEGLLEQVAAQLLPNPPNAGNSDVKRDITIERAAARLKAHLQIESIRKSDIISLSYTDRSPERAEEVLQKFLSDYEELHLRAHATPGRYDSFRAQADDYKSRLAKVEDQLSTLERTEHVLDLPQQEDLVTRARQSAEADMLAASASYEANARSLSGIDFQLFRINNLQNLPLLVYW